jgi:hypothetical protein
MLGMCQAAILAYLQGINNPYLGQGVHTVQPAMHADNQECYGGQGILASASCGRNM